MVKLKKKHVELEEQFVPTMIAKAVPPHKIRVLPRGRLIDIPATCAAARAVVHEADRTGWPASEPPRFGEVGRFARIHLRPASSSTGYRKSVRHGLVEAAYRHRLTRRGPIGPGSTRFARARLHRPHSDTNASFGDGDVGRVSAFVASAAGDRVHRPGESPAGPPIAFPIRC